MSIWEGRRGVNGSPAAAAAAGGRRLSICALLRQLDSRPAWPRVSLRSVTGWNSRSSIGALSSRIIATVTTGDARAKPAVFNAPKRLSAARLTPVAVRQASLKLGLQGLWIGSRANSLNSGVSEQAASGNFRGRILSDPRQRAPLHFRIGSRPRASRNSATVRHSTSTKMVFSRRPVASVRTLRQSALDPSDRERRERITLFPIPKIFHPQQTKTQTRHFRPDFPRPAAARLRQSR